MIALMLVISPALSWHSLGHMVVARIAHLRLESVPNGSSVFSWAESLIKPYSSFCGEEDYPFTDSATWPDKIKEQGWYSMANWHFANNQFIDGYTPEEDYVIKQDIVSEIYRATNYLKSTKVDTHGKSKSIFMKSLTMRNLIHFVGDIHQPLHTTSRYTPERTRGDKGGNLFAIDHYENHKWNNLHFIWDHLFDQGPKDDVWSPVNGEEYTYITSYAQKVMETHSYESLEQQINEHNTGLDWSQEGHDIVTSFVYKGLEEGKKLPADYIEQGKLIVNQRLALGGYRLANRLTEIYNELKKKAEEEIMAGKKEITKIQREMNEKLNSNELEKLKTKIVEKTEKIKMIKEEHLSYM